MRVAVAGFYFEANSFTTIPVDEPHAISVLAGRALHDEHAGKASVLAGYIDYQRLNPDFTLDLIGLARISPGPAIADAVLARTIAPFLETLRHDPAVDGVLLALHGSAMTTERHDVDADFVAAVRALVGTAVPIAVTLDMHANVSPRLAGLADIVTSYRTTPHVDMAVRGFDTARLLHDAIAGRTAPVVAIAGVPLAAAVLHQNTAHSPMREIIEAVEAIARQAGVLSLDVTLGTAYGDSPSLGMSAICVADGDHGAAQAVAAAAAEAIWTRRRDLCTPPGTIAAAIAHLREAKAGRTLLIDSGDNVYGGAAGTALDLFSALIDAGVTHAFAPIFAPALLAAAEAAGIGGHITVDLGSAGGARKAIGTVSAIRRLAPPSRERVALVMLESGNDLALCSDRMLAGDLARLFAEDIVPPGAAMLLAKGDHRTVVALGDHIDRTIWISTSGATTPLLDQLPYHNRPRPLYPLEEL